MDSRSVRSALAGVSCWMIRMATDSLVEVIDGPPLPDDAFPQPRFGSKRAPAKKDLVLGMAWWEGVFG